MNRKICELINILINSANQYFKYDDLARLLSVSTRSIRNYISQINYFLSGQNITHFIKITNKGITFTGNDRDGDLLASMIIDLDFYFYKLSSEERVSMISLKLMLSAEACTISTLATQFNASRVTIIKDMDQVRIMFDRYHMSLDTATNYGYLLVAEEKDRRELISKIVLNSLDSYPFYTNKVNIYEFFLEEEYFRNCLPSNYAEIVRKAEDDFNITVSDAYFEKVLFYLKLMTFRVFHGFILKFESEEIPQIKKLSVYQIASNILETIEHKHKITFSDSEIIYLAHKLYENHFYNIKIMEDNRCIHKHIVVNQFLEQVGRELMIPLSDDRQLNEQLGNHLSDMKKVHNSGTVIQNDFREQIIKEYPIYYEVIEKNKNLLESHFGYQINKDEVAYIILYIVVAVERYFEGDTIPKAIVVCHAGVGTANYLVEELKSNFNIKIVTATSSHKLEDTIQLYDYDLIISTISLHNEVGNWIKVNPMLDDKDIIGLQRILFNIKRHKRNCVLTKMQHINKRETITATHLQRLEQVLPIENIDLEVSCKDWRDAIHFAAGILLRNKSITKQYIQAIEDSVIVNGAYFVYCPGVALAHSGPTDGVVRFDISLIRLLTPVKFGHKTNDPVRYIICFGSTNQKEDTNLILKLMNMIGSPELLQQLDVANNKKSFYKHIIEYGGVVK